MVDGELMLMPCEGGPTAWRTGTFPPAVEFDVDEGIYILVDDGSPELWHYQFISGPVR